MKKYLFLLLPLFILGCDSEYPEFKRVENDVFVKLLELGENDGTTVCTGFQTTLSYKLYLKREEKNGFDYWNDYTFQNLTSEAIAQPILGNAICSMSKGDKNLFLFPYKEIKDSYLNDYEADSVLIADSVMMCMEIEVYDLKTEEQLKAELEKKYREGVIAENKYLRQHIESENLLEKCNFNQDVYWYYLEELDGEVVQTGSDIAIDYQGYFLDGTEFDNSTLGNATLYFQLGKPEQVIRGFEIVISQMKEGERIRAYVPSHLAFGAKGSSTGIVKEHTPLYFDIHLKEVYSKQMP